MNWLSLILILGGLDNLLKLLLFLAGVLFTSSVSQHHDLSLIFHRGPATIISHSRPSSLILSFSGYRLRSFATSYNFPIPPMILS